MYPVLTQAISCVVAPRFPAICGSATLMIVVSRTSMIAAVINPSRINQRYRLTSSWYDSRALSRADGTALTAGAAMHSPLVTATRPLGYSAELRKNPACRVEPARPSAGNLRPLCGSPFAESQHEDRNHRLG